MKYRPPKKPEVKSKLESEVSELTLKQFFYLKRHISTLKLN